MDGNVCVKQIQAVAKSQLRGSNDWKQCAVLQNINPEVIIGLVENNVEVRISREDIVCDLPGVERVMTARMVVDVGIIAADPQKNFVEPIQTLRDDMIQELTAKAKTCPDGHIFVMSPLTPAVKAENFMVEIFFHTLVSSEPILSVLEESFNGDVIESVCRCGPGDSCSACADKEEPKMETEECQVKAQPDSEN